MSDTPAGERGAANEISMLQRLNIAIRNMTGRYFNLWSVLTLAAVLIILLLCAVLWDSVDLRPALATIGAGLAAFLGPIPSIISPELRNKWLVSIFVSALIAAGTWFATQDLAIHLQQIKDQTVALAERLEQHKKALVTLLKTATPDAIASVHAEAGPLLKSLYLQHRNQEVLDLALPLLELDPNNGTSLSFVAYAYRALGNTGDTKKYLESYLALAQNIEAAKHGPQKDCYDNPAGFCGERTGWLSHLRATIAVREATHEPAVEKKLKFLAEAFEHEKRNVETIKWNRPGKDEGFDTNDEEPMSSCEVLQRVVDQLRALGRPMEHVATFRKQHLNCG
jgi:tetratricopeptide (TPR) repeat protein